jgi:ABC-2 type transport system ATP-binding protein
VIEVRELCKTYPVPRPLWGLLRRRGPRDSVCALERISFRVEEGEVLGLLGPNGAGKTTLIHILCTLLEPSSGEARVGGHDLWTEGARARALIGLVTSNERSFYWRLTGRQNLQFFAALFRVPRAQIDSRIAEFLDALELGEFADRRFDSYSTGVRQRFAFARALLHHPRVLFMDEPTKGLDPNAAAGMLQLIRERILSVWRPTILVTSHNLEEIEALCDRVAIIDQGRLLRLGSLGELARSIRAHESYRLQLRGADRKLVDGLCERFGADRVRARDAHTLEIGLGQSCGEDTLSDMLRYVLESGAEIRRCEPLDVSLAEVFRHTVPRRGAA